MADKKNNSIKEIKTAGNGSKKLHHEAKTRVLELLSKDVLYKNIIKAIKEEFCLDITLPNISYHSKTNSDLIKTMRIDYYEDDVFKHPIAHRGWRIWKLQNLFNNAKGKQKSFIQMRALALAEKETSEALNKLAEAIGSIRTGETKIVNIFDKIPEEDRQAVIDDTSRVLEQLRTGGNGDRF